jgi:DNA-binding transcriptional regulator YiaG
MCAMGQATKSALREFRRLRGLSQAQFAAWLSGRLQWQVSQSDISRWETGRRRMSRAIAAAFEAATAGGLRARSLSSRRGARL